MRFLKYTYLIFFIVLPELMFGQTFTASVNNTSVEKDDRFQVTFTFQGTDLNGLKNFSPPNFDNFLVLSGPNESTSMQIINGSVSASKSMSFYVQPRAVGNFTIGSASIVYNSKTYKTEPINIKVVKGSAKPNNSSSQNNSPQVTNEEIAKNLFVRAVADKRNVYQGEQVTVTYKLYTRLNIASQMSISKLPQYQGFWSEELEASNNISFHTEVFEGKQFRVGTLKRVALFPTQTGELSVTPFELTVPVQIQRRKNKNNFFDDFFNDPFDMGKTINYNAKSNTVKVNVRPLPQQNKPDNFNGAVGSFTLTSTLDNTKTKTNEPINLKINVSGTGNIQLLDLPEIKLPSGMEKYEPKTSEKINRQGKISGKKSFDYLLIPRTAGVKEIPSLKFSYFDPNKKQYITLNTPQYTVNVQQGKEIAGENYTGNSKEDVRMLGQDIRYIKTSETALNKQGSLVLFTFGFWAAAGFPLILLGGLITWKIRTDKLAGNLQLLRYQKAEKMAKSRLKTAKNLMSSETQTKFYTEISLALFGYLEDKLHIPKSEISIDRAVSELENRQINSNLISDLKTNAEKCEYVRFAPSADGMAAMNEMYDNMKKLIIDLDRSLSVKKHA